MGMTETLSVSLKNPDSYRGLLRQLGVQWVLKAVRTHYTREGQRERKRALQEE